MNTIAELLGPNIIANKILLKKANIKNYVVPFALSFYDSNAEFYESLGLKPIDIDIVNKYAKRIRISEKGIGFVRPKVRRVYHINSTYEQCENIFIKTYGLRPIEELKLEML